MCIVVINQRIFRILYGFLILLMSLSIMWAFCDAKFTKLINYYTIIVLFILRINLYMYFFFYNFVYVVQLRC